MGNNLATILSQLKELPENWLIGGDSRQLSAQCRQLYQEFISAKKLPKIILAESDPVQFLAGFLAAVAAGCPVFLCNPNWGKTEWQQVLDLVQPDIIFGQDIAFSNDIGTPETGFLEETRFLEETGFLAKPLPSIPGVNQIMIPTGGSSGKIRFAIHTWDTLMASVQGFIKYFEVERVNSVCVLPVYHVSGLMQFLRSFMTGGNFVIFSYKELQNYLNYANFNPEDYFISLVPTQLHRLLQNAETTLWLSRFSTVLLGGAPAWLELLENARKKGIKLAPTYGMTETASQVVTLKPADFLAGNNTCGQVLPHAKIKICNSEGKTLLVNQTGIITIEAESLTWGYYSGTNPKFSSSQIESFKTDDVGFLDHRGYLTVVGRNSDKIITGGENVFPTEVEAAIFATHLVKDVCALGLPDREWGQAVTAVYIPRNAQVVPEVLRGAIGDKLSKFKLPKHWLAVESLPRNSQGKVNRDQVRELVYQMGFKL